MIQRTERDILRAYRVYKCLNLFRDRVSDEEKDDANLYMLIAAFTALYNGITMSELQKILPIKRETLKTLVRSAVYKYGILEFNGQLVIGHRSFLDKGSKGVITISQSMLEEINEQTRNMKVGRKLLTAFASVLSNSSAHVIIMRDNIKNISGKGVLKHIYSLWLALLGGNLYSGSEYAKNLTDIGYVRPVGGNVELNRRAVFFKKEPDFELRTICKNS